MLPIIFKCQLESENSDLRWINVVWAVETTLGENSQNI